MSLRVRVTFSVGREHNLRVGAGMQKGWNAKRNFDRNAESCHMRPEPKARNAESYFLAVVCRKQVALF